MNVPPAAKVRGGRFNQTAVGSSGSARDGENALGIAAERMLSAIWTAPETKAAFVGRSRAQLRDVLRVALALAIDDLDEGASAADVMSTAAEYLGVDA